MMEKEEYEIIRRSLPANAPNDYDPKMYCLPDVASIADIVAKMGKSELFQLIGALDLILKEREERKNEMKKEERKMNAPSKACYTDVYLGESEVCSKPINEIDNCYLGEEEPFSPEQWAILHKGGCENETG